MLKKDGPAMVKAESKLVVRDAMKLTPPCGRHAITESFAVQRRIGIKSATRQIERLFPFVGEMKVLSRIPARVLPYLQKYIFSGDIAKIKKVFGDFGVNLPIILREATKQLHDGARDAEGRVQKHVQYPILNKSSRDALIKHEVSQVGKGKAGWVKPARALGLSVPKWISQHATSGDGVWNDRTTNTVQPFVELGNLVEHANEGGARLGVMRAAMANRARSIRKRVEIMVKKMAKVK